MSAQMLTQGFSPSEIRLRAQLDNLHSRVALSDARDACPACIQIDDHFIPAEHRDMIRSFLGQSKARLNELKDKNVGQEQRGELVSVIAEELTNVLTQLPAS
jgi:hypothetical protein